MLLHGLTATRRYVVMGSRSLQRSGHLLVGYDARGHGGSSPPVRADAYDYAELAADLLAVLDELELATAVLVGASMGAHTALCFALAHPERVAGLVLVTPSYDPATHGDPASLARWDCLAQGLRRGGVAGFMRAYGDPGVADAWRDTVLRATRQRLEAHRYPQAVADALSAVPRSRPFADLRDLQALSTPGLVIGSRDEADPGHPLATAEAYAAALPGARLQVEEPGQSPLAWQGGRVSALAAAVSAQARVA